MTSPHHEDWLGWQGQIPGEQHLLSKRPKLTVLTSEGKIRVHFIGLVDT